jgi:hypothetical protein
VAKVHLFPESTSGAASAVGDDLVVLFLKVLHDLLAVTTAFEFGIDTERIEYQPAAIDGGPCFAYPFVV